MLGNSMGRFFGVTSFGESHGPAVGVVIEDVRPGVEFPLEQIQKELDRRRANRGKWSSSRSEQDRIQVLSGLFEGRTTGMPICLVVYNHDQRSKDYEDLKSIFRPGHADITYFRKFKIYDYRGGGRASGRETIARVAAGNAVDFLLGDIRIDSYPVAIGNIEATCLDQGFDNELLWPDRSTFREVVSFLDRVKNEGDSAGGIIETRISGIPAGLGDPVFEKLDANIAKAVISVGAVKGIEFGTGFRLAAMKGSQSNDQIGENGFLSSEAGGILGGISTGQEISFRYVVKPVPSISIAQKTVDTEGKPVTFKAAGRFDVCLIPRIIPVTDAMVKLVLADAISYQKLLRDKESDLMELREAIDKIDEDILVALVRRMKISKQIGQYKIRNKIKIEDPSREKHLIELLKTKAARFDLDSDLVPVIWKAILEFSKKKQ